MKKRTNYFLLSGLFLAGYLVTQVTDVYGSSGWVEVFLLFMGVVFLIIGISRRTPPDKGAGD
ncbi:MAG: hypothetical protein RBT71_01530 [Flavobacteriales bacterium]|jgi:hypothetical protein|nr:hypothetical protein [Flavobacteriales bacterium]